MRGKVGLGNTREGLIEGNMLGLFDLLSVNVKIENISKGLGKTKKDANPSIMDEAGRPMSASRQGVDTTTKRAKRLEVGHFTGAKLKTGLGPLTMITEIVKADIVVKCVRPKLGGKSSTSQACTESVFDGAMRALARGVLMRRVSSGRLDSVASIFKKSTEFTTTSKLTTKIHADIFVSNILATAMLGKPAIDEIDWRSLTTEGLSVKCTTLVIGEQDVTTLTVETQQAEHAVAVFRSLHNKTHINGDALIADSSAARVSFAPSMLGQLLLGTDRAWAQFGIGDRQLRQTKDSFLEMVHATGVQMAEAMMPQDPILLPRQGMNDASVIRSISEGRRPRIRASTGRSRASTGRRSTRGSRESRRRRERIRRGRNTVGSLPDCGSSGGSGGMLTGARVALRCKIAGRVIRASRRRSIIGNRDTRRGGVGARGVHRIRIRRRGSNLGGPRRVKFTEMDAETR
jgi:hypothetical protein